MIKYWSLLEEYKKNKKKILSNISKTLNKGNIFFGDQLNIFEKTFIKKYKSKYGIAVGSGTDAILISLLALNLKKNDEVIVPANTAIPTISAIINAGGKPKLIDVENDYLISISKIKKAVNKNTKVIIPVHLYGQSCRMAEIIKFANKNKIKIIEDCAQAQGAKYENKFVGTFGLSGCFSFYPTKILGAYGDGGFILTNDFKFFEKIKRIRFYGIETNNRKKKFFNEYYSYENGINSRLDEIQSSILNLKLKNVENFIHKRRKIASIYNENLKGLGIQLPKQNSKCYHVYNTFTLYHKKRKYIMKYLKKNNIQTRVIYPYPIHEMKSYEDINKAKDLNNTTKLSKGIFSIPLYPELKSTEILRICKYLKNCMKSI